MLSRGLAVTKTSAPATVPAGKRRRGGPSPRARRDSTGRPPGTALADRPGITLAGSRGSGLNVGYLSQIENDKAFPSLEALASLADALHVPIGWFLIDDTRPPGRPRRRASGSHRRRGAAGSNASTAASRGTSRSSRRTRNPGPGPATMRTPATNTTSSLRAAGGWSRTGMRSRPVLGTTSSGTPSCPTTSSCSATNQARCSSSASTRRHGTRLPSPRRTRPRADHWVSRPSGRPSRLPPSPASGTCR